MAPNTPARWPRILSLALAVSLPLAMAPAQSYPKLVTSGHGLALTRFSIQERSNGQWIASPTLRQGVDYRLVWRLTNFFPDVGHQWGHYVTDIIRLTFWVAPSTATNMTFYSSDSYSGALTQPPVGEDDVGLRPTQSKTYYQHFRWKGPAVATPVTTFNVDFRGAEVHWLPLQAGPIRPS